MVTLQELQARHSPEKQARIRAFAEELLKTFEANHATYVNARKALEAAKLMAAKAKDAEKAAKAEEKTREKAKAKAAEASKEKTQA